ncbi:choline transporter-like protein 1 isoform X2 [Ptychodera flava]|uniref:choline transporter-like protein 1 isoform X2 n=1 Tax=Ptychodera flava TaxID=63121 RepID=UPI00396A34C8
MGCCGGSNKVEPFDKKDSEDEEEFDGPTKDRSCRDVICCLIFLAFWGGMGYIAYVSILNGQPERLVFGVDSYGNVCGIKNKPLANVSLSGMDMRERKYVFYFNFLALSNPLEDSKVICVAGCPNGTFITANDVKDYAIEHNISLCSYDVDISDYTSASYGDTDDCPTLPLTSQITVLNRCLPADLLSTAASSIGFLNADLIKKIMSDIEKTWLQIVYLCAISVGLALVMTVIMRFFAKIIIYVVIIIFVVGSLAGTAFLWYLWYDADQKLKEIPSDLRLDSDKENVKTWLIYASVASGVTLILLLILLVMRKRIGLVVALFTEAGKAIAYSPFLLIQPFWTFLTVAILAGYWLFVYLYLATAGQPQVDSDTGFVEYVEDKEVTYFFWYHLFGLLWGSAFLWACQEITIAGAVAMWYFTRDKKNMPTFPILTSMYRVLRYHLGSVAFGSFLIALVQLARIILSYIQAKLQGAENKILQFLLKCLQCCLWCFEKFLKFINRNAYIEIAIHGYNFCKAAQRAFVVIVANALRVAAINSVGDFCLFLGKLAVVAATAVIGVEVFFKDLEDVHYEAIPIALACVFAFIISHTFLSVYEMTIDTIFICFCEDCEMNDGVTKPYFMSMDLMTYVDNASEAKEATEMRQKQTAAEKKMKEAEQEPK